MSYEIQQTDVFQKWFKKLKDPIARLRIIDRIEMIEFDSHFGDYKSLGDGLFELRFFVGNGYRVYYTIRNNVVVLLLHGGSKDSQDRDIEKAKKILDELE